MRMLSRARRGWPAIWRLAGLIAGGALCWGAGFVWFLNVTARPVPAPPAHVDGVVALTGGAGRIELALHFLAARRADKLLVSGIGGNTDLATLGRLAGVDSSSLASRITLGRYAASTRGNAIETAAWAAQNHIETMIVVTASYHMPRALAELRQAAPTAQLFPQPVQMHVLPAMLSGLDHGSAERRPSMRLQAEEFSKYLLVVAGLSPWFPHREAGGLSYKSIGAEE